MDRAGAGGSGVDIMAVAAALGAGATDAVDDVVGEFVARPVFVAEVRELLMGAEERAAAFEAALADKEVRRAVTSHMFIINQNLSSFIPSTLSLLLRVARCCRAHLRDSAALARRPATQCRDATELPEAVRQPARVLCMRLGMTGRCAGAPDRGRGRLHRVVPPSFSSLHVCLVQPVKGALSCITQHTTAGATWPRGVHCCVCCACPPSRRCGRSRSPPLAVSMAIIELRKTRTRKMHEMHHKTMPTAVLQRAFKEGCAAGAYAPAEQKRYRAALDQQRAHLDHSLTSVRWCQAFLSFAEGPDKEAAQGDGPAAAPMRGVPPEATARRR